MKESFTAYESTQTADTFVKTDGTLKSFISTLEFFHLLPQELSPYTTNRFYPLERDLRQYCRYIISKADNIAGVTSMSDSTLSRICFSRGPKAINGIGLSV